MGKYEPGFVVPNLERRPAILGEYGCMPRAIDYHPSLVRGSQSVSRAIADKVHPIIGSCARSLLARLDGASPTGIINLHEGVRRREKDMKSRIVLSTAVAGAAMLGAAANADVTVNLGDFMFNGGEFDTVSLNLAGTLTQWDIQFTYGGNTDGSWSADMLFGVDSPNDAIEAGGFDLTYGFEWLGGVGQTNGDPGTFNNSFNSWAGNMSGSGTWTLYVGDGWSFTGGNLETLTDVSMTLHGVDLVPAPGAIALLGAAGLLARRRRRA
jgi:hypothetical protein